MSTDLVPIPQPEWTAEIIPIDRRPEWARLIQMVLDGLTSPHSKRAYRAALEEFLRFYMADPRQGFTKAAVQSHRAALEARGLAPATINVRLAAIRKLAVEAADNGLLAPELAAGIARAKGVKRLGVRMGNWLTFQQFQDLLEAPPADTLKGKRDRAMLAVLLGCALRRSEASALTVEQITQREARWVILDLVGKGGRVRTVPMTVWVKLTLDQWLSAAGIAEGRVFRAVNSGGHLGNAVSPQVIRLTLRTYSRFLDIPDLAPHDLRRTWAKLARKYGAALEQIQQTLGHSSIQTTERYLGGTLDLANAAVDAIPSPYRHLA